MLTHLVFAVTSPAGGASARSRAIRTHHISISRTSLMWGGWEVVSGGRCAHRRPAPMAVGHDRRRSWMHCGISSSLLHEG